MLAYFATATPLSKYSTCSPRQTRGSAWAQVTAELDEKKREALERTGRKVDADFGSIFAMVLPGTFAKLETPEGASFLAGARPQTGSCCSLVTCTTLYRAPAMLTAQQLIFHR